MPKSNADLARIDGKWRKANSALACEVTGDPL